MRKAIVIIISFMMVVVILGMGSKTEAEEMGNTVNVETGLKPVSENVGQQEAGLMKTGENAGNTAQAQGKEKIKRIRIIGEQDKRKLCINDEKGKLVKEIKIGETITEIKEKDREGKLRRGKKREVIDAAISDNSSTAIIVKYNKVILEGLQGYEQPDTMVKLEIMDEKGEVKWKKEFKNRGINASDVKITNNNLVVFRDAEDSENFPGTEALHVFNENGEEIFKWNQGNPENFSISPNGKYLGIGYSTKTPPYKRSVLFFNLSNGKSWDMGKSASIKKIDNNGFVYIFKMKESIDLKSKLGE
ncbi:MAG: hypothetical protein KA120_08845 [Candidatus Goldbacteria bacterium]|nr:hypothetical protein [Candidatus Goldiibacteriota bacterium]